jgi:8-oxo-dGTP pyrophosphatase MutT (NUDIX family)
MTKLYKLAATCCINVKSKFLIIERPKNKSFGGLLSFPGGKVDPEDEKYEYDILRACAKREVLEEVGIYLDINSLIYITSGCFNLDGITVINSVFYTNLEEYPEVIPKLDEVPKYFWMTIDEVKKANNTSDWFDEYFCYITRKISLLSNLT